MDRAEPLPRGATLARWLAIAIVSASAALAAVLWWLVAPSLAAALRDHGATALTDSAATMHALIERRTEQQSRVLVDLIHHTTSARAAAIEDLPLESYGDVQAMRRAIAFEDAQHSDRQRRNVEVLAAEVRRRADAEIRSALDVLRRGQSERSERFVAELHRTHLWLVAGTLAVLLLVLGLGLHLMVVRPTLRLRQATRRVARGELTVDLPAPQQSEIGELARDFTSMVGQLRESRAQLQQLAQNLELEVDKKTRHLEQTLADLRSSSRRLAEAERLAALGTLAGGMAHEFHNLIGGIRGCAGELLADEHDDGRRETLGVITRAADRATGIVQQLQRFARQPVDRRERVELAALLGDALRLCEPAARRQRVELDRELDTPVAIHGDPDALHQVFVNLMVNALQAMPSGGRLRVALAATGSGARITVADTGPGIPADALPHIFEPFFTTRADAAEPAQRGSGLGLAVSFGIVTAHRGEIAASSTPGAGATFTVDLPA